MRSRQMLAVVAVVLLGVVGCSGSTDKVDGGGVILSVSNFDGLPVQISMSVVGDLVSIGEVTLENIAKNSTAEVSDLMNVELQSYEVTYSRADQGTRVPTDFVRGLFGAVPVNSTAVYENLPVMSLEQLLTTPLSDLVEFGRDTETGGSTILLNCRMRFFGRTLSGDAIETGPQQFTIEFVP